MGEGQNLKSAYLSNTKAMNIVVELSSRKQNTRRCHSLKINCCVPYQLS